MAGHRQQKSTARRYLEVVAGYPWTIAYLLLLLGAMLLMIYRGV